MTQVRLITLEGQIYDLTFDDAITIPKIQEKLFNDYNVNTYQCYFCRNGHILNNEQIIRSEMTNESHTNPIIIFNPYDYHDKSFPRADDAIQMNFSRYSDSFVEFDFNKGTDFKISDHSNLDPSMISYYETFNVSDSDDDDRYSYLKRKLRKRIMDSDSDSDDERLRKRRILRSSDRTGTIRDLMERRKRNFKSRYGDSSSDDEEL